MESRTSSRPMDRPSTTGPAPDRTQPGRPPRQDSMPMSPGSNAPRPQKAASSSPQPPTNRPQQPQAKPGGPKPPAPKPATPAAPPGKGPKTFDEMGIGQAPKENDCVVM
jgi:hypothetical protein